MPFVTYPRANFVTLAPRQWGKDRSGLAEISLVIMGGLITLDTGVRILPAEDRP